MAGRKKSYDNDTFPLLGEKLARNGLSDKEIAKGLGIGYSTYYDYLLKYKEFSEAIKRGKKPVDVDVENALLKRAMGFEYEEKHTEVEIGSDGQPKPAKIKTIKKLIPGDVAAMIFWLKNRSPEYWREKQEIKHEGTIQTVDLTNTPTDELLKRAEAIRKINEQS